LQNNFQNKLIEDITAVQVLSRSQQNIIYLMIYIFTS